MALLFVLAATAGQVAEAEAHKEVGAHESGGLPQLAVETFPGQLFWLVLTFGVLFLVMNYVIVPRIRGVLQARQGKIAGDLADAAAAKGQADAALKAYEKAVNDARARGRAMAEETRAKVKAETDAARAAAEAKVNADVAAAETRIAEMKASAMSNVQSVASETAAEIVDRLSGETISSDEAGSAVGAVLAR